MPSAYRFTLASVERLSAKDRGCRRDYIHPSSLGCVNEAWGVNCLRIRAKPLRPGALPLTKHALRRGGHRQVRWRASPRLSAFMIRLSSRAHRQADHAEYVCAARFKRERPAAAVGVTASQRTAAERPISAVAPSRTGIGPFGEQRLPPPLRIGTAVRALLRTVANWASPGLCYTHFSDSAVANGCFADRTPKVYSRSCRGDLPPRQLRPAA